jgi:hypothetical protein
LLTSRRTPEPAKQHRDTEVLDNSTKHCSCWLGKKSWVYNGSLLEGHSFLAQREGSIVSLVTDPEALINNTGPGRDNDTIWTTRTNNLPLADVPLEVVIKLSSQKQKTKEK